MNKNKTPGIILIFLLKVTYSITEEDVKIR